MNPKITILNLFLATILLVCIPDPSSAFGIFKGGGGGGGGGSNVAEILAAGLITGLLMDNSPIARPMMQALSHPFMGGYGMMPHLPMHHMMAARMPMMGSYAMPMMHRPHFMMHPHHRAMMARANHQAMASRLNQEIRALEEQESMLEAYLSKNQQEAESEINLSELLGDDDSIPAAALLIETADLVNPSGNMERAHPIPHPEMYQTSASEPESRYILPRIVRHFVQRLMRRGQNH